MLTMFNEINVIYHIYEAYFIMAGCHIQETKDLPKKFSDQDKWTSEWDLSRSIDWTRRALLGNNLSRNLSSNFIGS